MYSQQLKQTTFSDVFAGPSMGNSADADQMLPDVALHLSLHC